eukprot:TRINITY_DN19105_c0_g1_i1.p1 TRINITY_DN19105_c0_g1~~TRINITY_DN19105_c0_g1_i1.p1  ORF type:complete len:217 (-),score=36.35 TRINITY_DN19105_c0_g1_i1:52-702(-)
MQRLLTRRLLLGARSGTGGDGCGRGAKASVSRAVSLAAGAAAASALLPPFHSVRCHAEASSSEGAAVAAESRVADLLSTLAAGTSVVAAAAPALCAVHCAAMPVAAVLLPSLQLSGGAFGGVCMHGIARKLAIYFVVPVGLLANAVGYSQHQNPGITATSLSGVTLVTAAAAWPPVAAYRNYFNFGGCGLMLGSQYYANQLAKQAGHDHSHCCGHH